MRNLWKVVVVATMAAALTVSGFAKPGHGNGGGKPEKPGKPAKPGKPGKPGNGGGNGQGNGNGGGNNGGGNGHGKPDKPGKPGKPGDAGTSTILVGTVVTSDSRILDLSGDYVLSGTLTGSTSSSIALSIVQDDRGRLVASSSVVLADGTTTEAVLEGHLQLTGQTNLRFQLTSGDDDSDEIEDDSDDSDSDDSLSSGTAIKIVGYWNGTSFDTTVRVEANGVKTEYTTTVTPVNPARGFTIADTTQTLSSKKVRSTRTVTLPWGTETVNAQQQNKKGQFTFMAHSGDFGVDLRGSASATRTSLYRAKVHLGYGSLELDPASVTISPSATIAP